MVCLRMSALGKCKASQLHTWSDWLLNIKTTYAHVPKAVHASYAHIKRVFKGKGAEGLFVPRHQETVINTVYIAIVLQGKWNRTNLTSRRLVSWTSGNQPMPSVLKTFVVDLGFGNHCCCSWTIQCCKCVPKFSNKAPDPSTSFCASKSSAS